LASASLNVLYDLLYCQACGLRRLLKVLDREMSGVSVILMQLATSTGHTHIYYPLCLRIAP
jgi:hypothetical protein